MMLSGVSLEMPNWKRTSDSTARDAVPVNARIGSLLRPDGSHTFRAVLPKFR
jgi:hypothetical protein